jgi:hypothetical protein
MKYKVLFKERYKPAQYVITNAGRIVWTTDSLQVWIDKPVIKMLRWVENKCKGSWSVAGSQCQPPRVTRSYDQCNID